MLSKYHRFLPTVAARYLHAHQTPRTKHRVCVIGAGPAGMNLLGMFKNLKGRGTPVEVTCYEKQNTPGGMWNFTWRTGTDEYGEPLHSSLYRDLFSTGPKECLELPNYTFVDHFGKSIPSFLPREVILDYLKGYWKFLGVKDSDVKTAHCVRDVKYDDVKKTFTIRVTDFKAKIDHIEEFDYVVVSTGHFSTPNLPAFTGMNSFTGRVLHSHSFRSAREFQRQDVVVVGSSYCAEDIALLCYKFGANNITISHYNERMNRKWPRGIVEKPILKWLDNNTVHFQDGSLQEADSIILCTGYKHYFPFMPKKIRLECQNLLFPPNLYQGLQWYATEPGQIDTDGRLFYMAMQGQCYTFPMFMMQAHWVSYVIKGLMKTPDREYCVREIKTWYEANEDLHNYYRQIDAQSSYLKRLCDQVGYTVDLDASEIYYEWEWNKQKDILTYRDHSHKSRYTGHKSPHSKLPWLHTFDTSLRGFMND